MGGLRLQVNEARNEDITKENYQDDSPDDSSQFDGELFQRDADSFEKGGDSS